MTEADETHLKRCILIEK